MSRKFPVKIVALITMTMIAAAPSFPQTTAAQTGTQAALVPTVPPLSVSSETTNGYQIVITNPSWKGSNFGLPSLGFDFVVNHADGTPVAFSQPDNAITVTGWQDSNFDAGVQHSDNAHYKSGQQKWTVSLPGVDPRQADVHLSFNVRSPTTTPGQTTNLVSDFRFNNLPVPTDSDVTQSVNESFTTYFQTVITLTGITFAADGNNGQPEERFDFTIDHSRVPDDILGLQMVDAFDNGVRINDIYPEYNGVRNPPVDKTTVWTAPIKPGSHKSISIEFQAGENAFSTISSVAWTTLTADFPLAGIPFKADKFTVLDQSSTTSNGVDYTVEHVKNPQSFNDLYYILSQSADATLSSRIDKAKFSQQTNSPPQDYSPTPVAFRDVYWHPDGTPVLPGESGAYVQLPQNSNQTLPLSFTSTEFTHKQDLVKFSHIAIPAPGQVLILDQLPDKPTIVPIRLRSISFQTPDNSGQYFAQMNRVPEELTFVFEYDVSDSSQVDLAPVATYDDQKNAINVSTDNSFYPPKGASTVDSQYQTITLSVSAPTPAAKTIDLSALITKETPAGPSTVLTVGTDGKLTATE